MAIFADPVNGNMEWREIESLLVAIGCRISEGSGSTSIVRTQTRPRSGIG